MNINDVRKERKMIAIKVSKNLSDWLYANSISPTKLFNKSCQEMGYIENEQKQN